MRTDNRSIIVEIFESHLPRAFTNAVERAFLAEFLIEVDRNVVSRSENNLIQRRMPDHIRDRFLPDLHLRDLIERACVVEV